MNDHNSRYRYSSSKNWNHHLTKLLDKETCRGSNPWIFKSNRCASMWKPHARQFSIHSAPLFKHTISSTDTHTIHKNLSLIGRVQSLPEWSKLRKQRNQSIHEGTQLVNPCFPCYISSSTTCASTFTFRKWNLECELLHEHMSRSWKPSSRCCKGDDVKPSSWLFC
jgi:hypothetical protein